MDWLRGRGGGGLTTEEAKEAEHRNSPQVRLIFFDIL